MSAQSLVINGEVMMKENDGDLLRRREVCGPRFDTFDLLLLVVVVVVVLLVVIADDDFDARYVCGDLADKHL